MNKQLRPLFSAVQDAQLTQQRARQASLSISVGMVAQACQQQQTAHIGPASLAGTIIAVSATVPATFDLAGFTASGIDYVTITNVKTFPKIGSKRNVTDWVPINGDATHIIGTPNYGGGDMVVADVPSDAGVVILKAAEAAPNNLAMKITFPDSEVMYLWLLVSSFEYSFGDNSAVKELSVMLSVQKRPVIVAAV